MVTEKLIFDMSKETQVKLNVQIKNPKWGRGWYTVTVPDATDDKIRERVLELEPRTTHILITREYEVAASVATV
jgi:hypothetical protein